MEGGEVVGNERANDYGQTLRLRLLTPPPPTMGRHFD